MQQRETQRVIPDNPKLWFALTLGDKGEHHFRFPFPIYLLELLGEMEKQGLYDFKKRDDSKMPDRSTLERTKSLWELGAAAMGLCWYHLDLDLEARLEDHGDDYSAFGRAVLDELHQADYAPGDLMDAFPPMLANLAQSVVGAKKVEKREDFSKAQEDPSTS